MRKERSAEPWQDEGGSVVLRFLGHAWAWAGTLTLLAIVYGLVRAPHILLGPGHLVYMVAELLGLSVVFGAFAGGVAAFNARPEGGSRLPVLTGAALTGVVVLVLGTQISPRLEFRSTQMRGADLDIFAPWGPLTPSGYRDWLAYVRENPPAEPQLAVERLREHPPARVEFLLHERYVFPLLATLVGLIGYVVAELTDPVRPSRRRHVRWIVGLTMLPLVIVPLHAIESAVRARPYGSGLTAWAGLVAPGFVLTVCWAVAYAIRTHRERLERRGGAGSPGG